MKPRRSFEGNRFTSKARIVNFPIENCSHGSLEFLGILTNLKEFFIKFDPGKLERNYERRFCHVSLGDVKNLAKAVFKWKKLEKFTIHRSNLSEPIKIFSLLAPMKWMTNLKLLDFSFCCITSKESGEHFNTFLSLASNLQHLELKGNNLNNDFCQEFSRGIESFRGKFTYLGLSKNPTSGGGLAQILRSISEMANVQRIDISSCESENYKDNQNNYHELVNLVEQKGSISEINMQTNKIANEEMKENFIKALDKNFVIDEIQCEDCGEFS